MGKPSYAALNVIKFEKCSPQIKAYFWMLKELLENISSPEPALAYCFQNVEQGHRRALYALIVRRFRTDSDLTWKAIDDLDITRSNFPEFYKAINGKNFPDNLREQMRPAEKTRDKITHGRGAPLKEIHDAIATCLDYAEALNNSLQEAGGFKPYGDMRGVIGSKKEPLSKEVSRLVLKGLGLFKARAQQQAAAEDAGE